MMKFRNVLVSGLTLFLVLACTKEVPVSPVDPLPFPMDANKDLTVSPGDDFWRYCNGGWLSTAVLPEGQLITGGMYSAGYEISEKREALLQQDPVLARIKADANAMYAKPEISRAFLNQLLEMVPDPAVTSTEDYIRLLGRLLRMGAMENLLAFYPMPEDGIFKIAFFPLELFGTAEDVRGGAQESKSGEKSTRFLNLLAEGLGLDQSFICISPDYRKGDSFARIMEMSPQALEQALKSDLMKLQRFVDEEGRKQVAANKTFETVVAEVGNTYAHYLEYLFAQKYFTPEMKTHYTQVCERLRARFQKRIQNLDWMGESTKAAAIEKLQAMSFHVAYPDLWVTSAFPRLEEIESSSCFLEEYLKLNVYQLSVLWEMAGKAVKEYESLYTLALGYTISDVNACYEPSVNAIYINGSLLIPPFLQSGVTEAREYAAFYIVGHEITHGFDLEGSQQDETGAVKNWWTVADKMEFEERTQLLVDCYNHLEIAPDLMPGTYCNGTLTLSENIADLGGANLALDAYTEYLQEQGYFGSALQDQQRKFCESIADIWCCLYGEEHILSKTTGARPDVHALPRERVNGMMMNLDLWYELYGIDRSHLLYLPPERRTHIW